MTTCCHNLPGSDLLHGWMGGCAGQC
jgi:hypothetical protein